MGCVENAFHLLHPNAGILDIVTNTIRMGLEGLDDVLRTGPPESEIVFEEIIVTVYVGHSKNLQEERVVPHQIGDAGVRVDHHLIGKS
jgi:hypothetical protein